MWGHSSSELSHFITSSVLVISLQQFNTSFIVHHVLIGSVVHVEIVLLSMSCGCLFIGLEHPSRISIKINELFRVRMTIKVIPCSYIFVFGYQQIKKDKVTSLDVAIDKRKAIIMNEKRNS